MKVVIIKGNANEPLFICLERVKTLTGNSASAITRTAILEYSKKILAQEHGTTNQSKSE